MSGSWSNGAACAGSCGRLPVESRSRLKLLEPFLTPVSERPSLLHVNPWLVINRIPLRLLLGYRQPFDDETLDHYRESFYNSVKSVLERLESETWLQAVMFRLLCSAFGRPLVDCMREHEAELQKANSFYRPLSCSDDFGG